MLLSVGCLIVSVRCGLFRGAEPLVWWFSDPRLSIPKQQGKTEWLLQPSFRSHSASLLPHSINWNSHKIYQDLRGGDTDSYLELGEVSKNLRVIFNCYYVIIPNVKLKGFKENYWIAKNHIPESWQTSNQDGDVDKHTLLTHTTIEKNYN